MLNWLQHLFTARALERELSDTKARMSVLEAENAELKAKIEQLKTNAAIEVEKLRRNRQSEPRVADGVGYNPFDP